MRPIQIALFFFAASCAFAAPSDPVRPQTKGGLLPMPKAALEFPPGAKEVTLGWLVSELARLTGQELTMAPEVSEELEKTKEPLEITTPVPIAEVYPFVEGMLVQRNIFLAPVKGGERPVLAVLSAGRGQPSLAHSLAFVTSSHIEDLADHPALLCQIILNFENIDTRQLQTQLRQLLVDNTGLQQVVPAGERSLILQGPGAYLLGLGKLLQEVDRASAARPAPAPVPSEKPKPQDGAR